jgi:hypothetical protein
VTKILVKKIVSLYPIFFSKIVYLYRFKRYIFEYRCPTLDIAVLSPVAVQYGKNYENQEYYAY